jgi:hypothetical protein
MHGAARMVKGMETDMTLDNKRTLDNLLQRPDPLIFRYHLPLRSPGIDSQHGGIDSWAP